MKRKRSRVQRVTDSAVGWQNECAKYQRATVALLVKIGGHATLSVDELRQAQQIAEGQPGLGVRFNPGGGVSLKVELPRIIVPRVNVSVN